MAGPGPPTHGSLFKPPPILYSSVRGRLLTQPDSARKTKPGPRSCTEEGRHAPSRRGPSLPGMSRSLRLLVLRADVSGSCVLSDRCQGDACVTIQTVRPRVSAVSLACPHAVRWDEGVWNHSLFQADNKHKLSLHSCSIPKPGSLILLLHISILIYSMCKHTHEAWNYCSCNVKVIVSDYRRQPEQQSGCVWKVGVLLSRILSLSNPAVRGGEHDSSRFFMFSFNSKGRQRFHLNEREQHALFSFVVVYCVVLFYIKVHY